VHRGQERRGSGIPYVQHVVAVAMILDRLGHGEDVVIAGLLHDVVEDTEGRSMRLRAVRAASAALVDHGRGQARRSGAEASWIDRRRDHLAALAVAPRRPAVVLAESAQPREYCRRLRAGRPCVAFPRRTRPACCGITTPRSTRVVVARIDRSWRAGRECRQRLAEVEALGTSRSSYSIRRLRIGIADPREALCHRGFDDFGCPGSAAWLRAVRGDQQHRRMHLKIGNFPAPV